MQGLQELLDKVGTYSDGLCKSSSDESGEDDGVTHCEDQVGMRRSDKRCFSMSVECGMLL